MRPHPKVEEIDRLFRQTLTDAYDGEKPWSAIHRLQRMGLKMIFAKASAWCTSKSWLKRARAANILCQLRSPRSFHSVGSAPQIFVEESFTLLCKVLEGEQNDLVLMALIFGLGHLNVESAVPFVLPYVSHANEDVRFAVTHALGAFPQNSAAIESLQSLADDRDKDVRNWALFAIGTQSDLDTPALRETLARHLNDPYKDAREEAIAGLAKRTDERAVLPLLRLLHTGSYYRHLEDDYEILLGCEEPAEGWSVDAMRDRLYERFPHMLPARL